MNDTTPTHTCAPAGTSNQAPTHPHGPSGQDHTRTNDANAPAHPTTSTTSPNPRQPRRHSRRRFLLGAGAAVGPTAAGTAAWALNRFVIDHVAISDVAAYEAAHASAGTSASADERSADDPSAATLTDTSYTSPTSSATLTRHTSGSGSDTWYTAELTLADPTTFGPPLVTDGQVVDGIDAVEVDTNVGNHSIQGNQPRTAVGMIEPGRYLLMVVDGRSKGYSRGVTLPELAQMMLDAGATTVYNLDSGGSAALYWNGRIVNQPSNGSERATSDILYLTKGA